MPSGGIAVGIVGIIVSDRGGEKHGCFGSELKKGVKNIVRTIVRT